ncbi:probable phosphoglycerate mutase [Catalinimonas alkaloidigena]|uniref:Probable phosphoglycerate mutase n=1 Tax=Catalinimonas alkaloidigena TaxID=1075417 RepID=A0A1G9H1L1_9BACT|nr:histidine phosphatase family protein [Catalinimonas alkaloidigena]SDL06848.1 probable phosphoglycerate mutase [Catalinimonas alkaloidigena]
MQKTKEIYLVRHGQTDFNLKGIVQGSGVDSDLNATGQQQAEAFFKAYRDIPFDKIYTSRLKRSQQSVQRFMDLGIPWEAHQGLNEINWGYREGKAITPEENEYYYSVIDAWNRGETTLRIDGGESPQDVADRQQPVLELMLSRPEEERILVCMHGRAMRILLCLMLHYELRCMDTFEHHNLGLYKLNYTGSMFSVERYNDIAHLQKVKSFG